MDESRYRAAERALWASEGLEPAEHWVTLASTGTRVRVQAVGEGEPVLFVHGVPNAGSTWAPLAPHVPGRRLLFLDRPGAGLSERHDIDTTTAPGFADRLVADVLDGLELERADVVASSLGSWMTLRSAAATPERVGRMVHLGCPAFVPGFRTIGMMRVLASPLRRVILWFPPNELGLLTSMKAIGHGATIAAGRFPTNLGPWYEALQVHTDTYVNEPNLIARLAGPVRGFDPSLFLDDAALSAVTAPCLLVWGADDPFGDEGVGAALREALPEAELVVLPDSGHLPWFDDPTRVGGLVTDYLAARPSGVRAPAAGPRS